jgi:two-component system sensor histidine kinase TctE
VKNVPTKAARPTVDQLSIKKRLAVLILGALVCFLVLDTTVIYQNTLQSINVAYDRTLLASARAIGDTVKYENGKLSASLPYATLEVFEAVTRGRIVYRVGDFNGDFLSGYSELPKHNGVFPKRTPYAALAAFYEEKFEGEQVRVAAMLQPVYDGTTYRMVTVQVAETLELRRALAREALISTLDRQVIFLIMLAALIWWLIGRGLRPISALRHELLRREHDSLAPITTPAPRELAPIVEALNEVMARLKRMHDNRQRFVRDASHQLRTPLAVLKAQVQNAQRGDMPPQVAFVELARSVDRATRVANQMLALAKVAQLDEATHGVEVAKTELVRLARDLAVECSPLLADKRLDFSLDAPEKSEVWVDGHDWMVRELFRNLISNAIRHSPADGALGIDIVVHDRVARMSIWDTGPGVDKEREARLFEPFSSGDPNSGSGLGLVICRDICLAIGAGLTLQNRDKVLAGTTGLRATAEFTLRDAPLGSAKLSSFEALPRTNTHMEPAPLTKVAEASA